MQFFNLDKFIYSKVLRRSHSLFTEDLNQFEKQLHEQIDGRAVLVIGGAGTIGSSYIKALLRFNPRRLYVIDINENGLTELVRDLRSSTKNNIPTDFKTYPIDFGSTIFKKIIQNEGPFEIIANFSAHKHVRSEKDVYSIEALIENNVLKAKRMLDYIVTMPLEHFFCVSTDKAANPVNIMGASKKLMEEVIMAYSAHIPITTARFANVAFSNGSLPLGFIERFAKHQPWSCPLDIKRFFVSPEESGQLCLLASILGQSGDIFFPQLDMKNDMKPFSDIAINLLDAWGFKPDICKSEDEARQKSLLLNDSSTTYPVYFFNSDTSGEKSYEEFYTETETIDLGSFSKLGVIKNQKKLSIEKINSIINNLKTLFCESHLEKSAVVAELKQLLPNFNHIETGKNLDQKM